MALYATAIGLAPAKTIKIREFFSEKLIFPLRLKVGGSLKYFPDTVAMVDGFGNGWPCNWFIYEKKEKHGDVTRMG